MVVSKEYHSAEVENSLPASKVQPSVLNVSCSTSLRQAMLSRPSFGTVPQQAHKGSAVRGAVTLGRWTTLGLNRSFGPSLISEALTGKWGNGTNALLSPLAFKTLLAVADLGQGGGTQSGRNTEFRQNPWVPGDGWGAGPGCSMPITSTVWGPSHSPVGALESLSIHSCLPLFPSPLRTPAPLLWDLPAPCDGSCGAARCQGSAGRTGWCRLGEVWASYEMQRVT